MLTSSGYDSGGQNLQLEAVAVARLVQEPLRLLEIERVLLGQLRDVGDREVGERHDGRRADTKERLIDDCLPVERVIDRLAD